MNDGLRFLRGLFSGVWEKEALVRKLTLKKTKKLIKTNNEKYFANGENF